MQTKVLVHLLILLFLKLYKYSKILNLQNLDVNLFLGKAICETSVKTVNLIFERKVFPWIIGISSISMEISECFHYSKQVAKVCFMQSLVWVNWLHLHFQRPGEESFKMLYSEDKKNGNMGIKLILSYRKCCQKNMKEAQWNVITIIIHNLLNIRIQESKGEDPIKHLKSSFIHY